MKLDTPPAGAAENRDPAQLGEIDAAIDRLMPALQAFLEFRDADRSVAERERWQRALDVRLPKEGAGLDTVLQELSEWIIPNGLRTPHPGFFGYIIGRATTAGLAAGVAAQVAGHFRYFLTSFNFLEQLTLDWLAELCGVRPGSSGVYSGGGSVANLIALGAARQAAFEAIGVDPAADGIPGGKPVRIYGGNAVHHTVHRSAGVLGLGRHAYTDIETDSAGRMDPLALERRIRADRAEGILPIAIVAVAGSTGSGAIDRIDAVADVAAEQGVWLHVDGAYGLPARCVPELQERFRGIERADSAITDPHKWLGTPVGCAATWVRDGDLLLRAFTQDPAPYLQPHSPEQPLSQFDEYGPPWYDQSVELHAPSRGVLVWATLREIGLDGVRTRIRRHVGFARRLAELAEDHARLQALLPPELSICCFRYRNPQLAEPELNALNQEIVRRLRAETPFVPSTHAVDGKLAIRACFVNASTTLAEVEGLASAVVQIGDRLVETSHGAPSSASYSA